ncbi:ABC transporter permease, partial [Streptococcus pyogenes]
ILIIVFINLVGLTLIHFIGEILTKSPYKKMVSTILMVISTVLVIVVLLFVQFTSQNQLRSKHPTDMPNIFLIRGFYDV